MIDCLYVCDGATQVSTIVVGVVAVAVSVGLVVSFGVVDASLLGPIPAEFIAYTR